MLSESFIGSLPCVFRSGLDGKNQVFHALLRGILAPYEGFLSFLSEVEEKTFKPEAGGAWLEDIAWKLFKIKRGAMGDEELLSEVYFAIFLKGNDGSNDWILSFIKRIVNPIDCFFIFNKLTMSIYFVLEAHLSKQQVEILRKIKPSGVTLEVFYTIGKKIIAVAEQDTVALYANGKPMDFNFAEAVVRLESVISLTARPPLEDAYFLVVEAESPEPVFSTNFIKII